LRLFGALLVLGPPTVLMGATLPLLVSQLELEGREGWRSTALLYATNTAGAALGCFVSGFFLLPAFGLRGTLLVALALNGVVVLLGALLSRTSSRRSLEARSTLTPGRSIPALTRSAFLLGLSALVLHMVWARQLSLVVGGTTFSFTAMLFIVLLGIGVGSALLELLASRIQSYERLFLRVAALLLVSALLSQLGLPALSRLAGEVREERGSLLFNALFCSGVSALLEFLPACCSGMLLPLLVRLAREMEPDAARSVGQLFAWNTLGATLGATLTAVLVLPWLGSTGGVVLACGALLLAAELALRGTWSSGVQRLVLPGLTGVLALIVLNVRDPLDTGLGLYLYGTGVAESLRESTVLFEEDGALANVLVTELGTSRSMRTNGKVDASNLPGDMVTQLGAAYFPRFLAPDARELLVVGYGSGCTVGASLLFPETRVTCLEIEPAVVRAAEHFRGVNHDPRNSPGLELVVEDARAYVESTSKRFDLIITEPSNPWMPGVSNLFTREFYHAAADRLAEDGLLVQWVQTYALSLDDYACIVATLRSEFEEIWLICLESGDTLLAASKRGFEVEPDRIDRLQRRILGLPEVRADLLNYFGSEDVRRLLLRHVLLRERDADLAPAGTELHTDWNMRLEYRSTRRLFDEAAIGDHAMLVRFLRLASPAFTRELHERTAARSEHAAAFHDWAAVCRRVGEEERASEWLAAGLELAPSNPELRADALIQATPEATTEFEARITELLRDSTDAAWRVGAALEARGELERALAIYDRVLAREPDVPGWFRSRAALLSRTGQAERAQQDLDRAQRLEEKD
jgi:spermidine synthase